jgi:hypothetical protein
MGCFEEELNRYPWHIYPDHKPPFNTRILLYDSNKDLFDIGYYTTKHKFISIIQKPTHWQKILFPADFKHGKCQH